MTRIQQREQRLTRRRRLYQWRAQFVQRIDRDACVDPLQLLGAELRAMTYRTWCTNRLKVQASHCG